MSRLPMSGQDNGAWGDILNDFLLQSHTPSGTLLAATDIADAKAKANTAVQTINGQSGTTINLAASQISFDKTGSTIITHTNTQQAVKDLETAFIASSGGGAPSFTPSALLVSNNGPQTFTATGGYVSWGFPTQVTSTLSAEIDPTDSKYIKILTSGVYSVTWYGGADNATAPNSIALYTVETGDWIGNNNFEFIFDRTASFSRTMPLKAGERLSLALIAPQSTGTGTYVAVLDVTRISSIAG